MIEDALADREIAQTVSHEWNRPGGGPLLISRLGMRLSPETKAIIVSSGHGLKRYVQEHLSGELRFLPLRSRGGGFAPLAATAGLTDQEVEARLAANDHRTDGEPPIPKYWGDIWRGFQTPLENGSVRYLLLDASDNPVVGTSPREASLPTNAKLIDRTDLVLRDDTGALPPRSMVHQAIENWCRREGVPLANLLYSRPQKAAAVSADDADARGQVKPPVVAGPQRTSALTRGLSLLTREEISRIAIPADLVLAILDRANIR